MPKPREKPWSKSYDTRKNNNLDESLSNLWYSR